MSSVSVGKEYCTSITNASMNKYSKLKKQINDKLFKCPCTIKTGEKVVVTDIIDEHFVLVQFRNKISVVAKSDLIE